MDVACHAVLRRGSVLRLQARFSRAVNVAILSQPDLVPPLGIRLAQGYHVF